MAKGQVRISDVAEAAGVSNTTVSHALSGKGRLPEETRQRVREVAEKLGYQPSALARGLAGGRTGMLAVTVSFVEDESLALTDFDYFMSVMNGASAAALERGMSLMLLPTDSRRDLLHQLPLDGAIVMDPVPGDEIVNLLDRRGIPVVTTGRLPDRPDDTCWVDNDHHEGTREIVDLLVDRGSSRLALLTAPVQSTYTQDALSAFESRCSERGVEAIVEHLPGDALSESGAYAAASRLLASERPPDGVYATLDRVALGALLAAEAGGVRVPEELRIAGCTDSTASRTARPALTALSLNPEQIGKEALDLLITLIEDGKPEDGQRLVPFSVIERGSTDPAKA